jgi:hypothetical protein
MDNTGQALMWVYVLCCWEKPNKIFRGTTEEEQALESESQELAKARCKFQGALPKEHR